MVNAQTWLDENHPFDTRSTKTALSINYKNLTGSLTLTGFNNLTTFYCNDNQLTNLNVNNCTSLTYLYCQNNNLTSLNTSSCRNLIQLGCQNNNLTSLNVNNCTSLTYLYCQNNNLTTLTIFSNLVSLKALGLANNSWTDDNFSPLQNLTNLTWLSIKNTNLTGLEYLPANLEKIYCTGKLAEQLKNYYKKGDYYNYQAWRRDNAKLIADSTKNQTSSRILSQ